MNDRKPLNIEIREILAREPGLSPIEVFERVTQKTLPRVVGARLCNMLDNGYLTRDIYHRYTLTGKAPGRRTGGVPYKSRTRRDEQADAKAEAEAARLFREFQKAAIGGNAELTGRASEAGEGPR